MLQLSPDSTFHYELRRILGTARDLSARIAYLRAAGYFRAADFFLHGKPEDPRIRSIWDEATQCFDAALPALDVCAMRITIQADGFMIPAVFYRPAADDRPRPTLLG